MLSSLNNRKLPHISLMPKEIGEVALPKSGTCPKLDDEVAWTQFIFVRLAEEETLTRIVSANNNVVTHLGEHKVVKRDIPVSNIEAIFPVDQGAS